MSGSRLPEGYEPVSVRSVEAFAWQSATEWLESVLSGAELHAWAARAAVTSRRGRGPVPVLPAPVPGPDGRELWAVRRYVRGGAAAFLGDLHTAVGPTRPLRELRASVVARERGVRTPAVVAGVTYPRGLLGITYAADLATELVPDVRSLHAIISEDGFGTAALAALTSAGGLVRALARAGIRHTDLSAGNVLVDPEGVAWVIDLDRARTLPAGRQGDGAKLLARLERSLRKLGPDDAPHLPPEARDALRTGFTGAA